MDNPITPLIFSTREGKCGHITNKHCHAITVGLIVKKLFMHLFSSCINLWDIFKIDRQNTTTQNHNCHKLWKISDFSITFERQYP